ncbi:MAG: DNA topoisomerase III [gamma proteobacterium symbiont of Taylorina sp.]|nr:DNA topoisomerase III [gamma proteobacterium symbiont of Taylorina sp.]
MAAQKKFELYLCEKPSQGRDIARALGANQRHDGYLQTNNLFVSWCIGHILEMQPPDAYDPRYKRWSLNDLPILPQQWQLSAKQSTRKQLTILGKLLKRCHSVVIATDADREGETIARELLEYQKFSGSIRRLWLSALDPISIKRALNSIKNGSETEALYHSGLARGRADWLIGMNLTRAFTLLANDRQVRSVGRVQTPTLALITRRDREISNFKAIKYYEIEAFFSINNQADFLKTKWIFTEQKKQDSKAHIHDNQNTEKQKYCVDKSIAQAVIDRCQNQTGAVSKANTQRKKQAPPLLYNLSGLQQEASWRWGYGAQEVLNIAQSLYETHKLTSYPRSDCEYLPQSQFNDVPLVLQALCKNDPALCELIAQANPAQRSRVWNDKKITAHHAIIPTQASPGISRLSAKEFNCYNLIRRRYLAQFFPDYEYDQSIIIITIANDSFKASGRISKVTGWKKALTSDTQKNPRAAEAELPAVTNDEQLYCDHLKLQEKLSKAPKHYTEGTLIKAMETIGSQIIDKVMKKILRETAGLGTQATRANIIQTLLQRQFIYKEKKLLKATSSGFNLIDTVPDTLKNPLLTAQWEQQLEDIANNKQHNSLELLQNFVQQQIHLLKAIISPLKPTAKTEFKPAAIQHHAGGSCPDCHHQLEIRQAVKGTKVGQNYIGCSHFPDCRFYFWP